MGNSVTFRRVCSVSVLTVFLAALVRSVSAPASPDTGFLAASFNSPPIGVYSLWSIPFDVLLESGSGPFRLHDIFEPSMGPMSDFTWRGFGMLASTLTPDPFITCSAGYWVNTLHPIIPPAGFQRQENCDPTIRLKPGWNIVGCPNESGIRTFEICVSVPGVSGVKYLPDAVSSGLLGRYLYSYRDHTDNLFNDGEWVLTGIYDDDISAECQPWTASLVRVYEELDFNFACGRIAGPTDLTGRESVPPPLWYLDIVALAPGGSRSSIRVGTREDSQSGWDTHDIPRPPVPFSNMEVSINYPNWGQRSDSFSESFMQAGLQEYSWPISIRNSSERTEIRWEGLNTLPSGFHSYLILGGSAAYELRAGRTLTIPTPRGTLDAEIRITASPWVGQVVADGRQGIIAVRNNPLRNGDMVIDYQVLVAATAELRLFDVAGRLVSQPLDVPGTPGTWQLSLETAASGKKLASGVYFAKLRLGPSVSSAKLIVVR